MKRSMEVRVVAIESCSATLQKEHHEAEQRMDALDKAVTAMGGQITSLDLPAGKNTQLVSQPPKKDCFQCQNLMQSVQHNYYYYYYY